MIELRNIHKSFRVAKRNAGFSEAVKALFKREYTTVHALDGISFTISGGESVGYIGPNGAGKSCTIKVMSGILHPDSGDCVINGIVPWKNRTEHVRNIGVVFGQRSQLWWDVPVIDSFELIRDIYNVSDADYRRSLDELIPMLSIADIVKTPTRQLSLGQRMRCEIAAALIHKPSILFLDEPTIGLDASSKTAVRSFIRQLCRERGTTVILTTHDMQDIEAITERIILIGRGRILLDGSLSELKARTSHIKLLTVRYSSGSFAPCEGIELIESQEGCSVFTVDTDIIPVSRAIAFLSDSADITDLSVEGSSAEDMVLSLYKEFDI